MKLYTYTHNYGQLETYKVVAPNRNTANIMLSLHCAEIGAKPVQFGCVVEPVVIQLSESEAWRRYNECSRIVGDEVDPIKD